MSGDGGTLDGGRALAAAMAAARTEGPLPALAVLRTIDQAERSASSALLLAEGRLLVSAGWFAEAAEAFGAAAELPDVAPSTIDAARGMLALSSGDVRGAAPLLQRSLDALDGTPAEDPRWRAVRGPWAVVLCCTARPKEAGQVLEAELRIARQSGDTDGQILALHGLGLFVLPRLGELEAAESTLREALRLAEDLGHAITLARVRNALAWVLIRSAHPDEALELSVAALEAAKGSGSEEVSVFGLLNRAAALGELGLLADGIASCDEALALHSSGYFSLFRSDLLALRARLVWRDHPAEALRLTSEALAAAERLGCSWTRASCRLQQAWFARTLGDLDLTARALAETDAVLADHGDVVSLLRWHALSALLELDRGRPDAAVPHVRAVVSDLDRWPPAQADLLRDQLVVAAVAADEGCRTAISSVLRTRPDLARRVAGRLTDHDDPVVAAWAIEVVAAVDEPWAWELLGRLRETGSRSDVVDSALERITQRPLPALRLLCLGEPGGLVVHHDTIAVPDAQWRSIQAKVVLARLVLDGPAGAEELAGMLWPDAAGTADAAKVGSRLHSTVRMLRQAIRPGWLEKAEYVVRSADGYALATATDATSDVGELEALLRRDLEHAVDWHLVGQHALSLARGPFLAGVDGIAWVDARRRSLHDGVVDLQESYARLLLRHGHPAQAEQHARRVVEAAPLREPSWRLLMLALHGQDRSAEALGVYHELVLALRDNAGLRPSHRTARVAARIHAARPAPTASPEGA